LNVHTTFFDPNVTEATDADVQKVLTRRERKKLRRSKENSKREGARDNYTPLKPKSETQADYIECLTDGTQVFGVGPAGTGKTYIPARMAASALKARKIEKIYIARPTVTQARHKQGFLPGKLEQKLAPWLVPLMDAFKDEVNSKTLEAWMREKKVEFLSFEHMRGRTFKDCWVILDEAQNCTFADLKLFLTRKGENSVYVVTGDTDQTDIEDSGLAPVIGMIEDMKLSPDLVIFDETECVRSEEAREWVEAFSRVSHG
jgi:phosphate starvation-inducible protein PhoH and related proteins